MLAAVAAGWLALLPGPLSAQSYLLNEGFEGTGFENSGWTSFSSSNPDYTAAPLVGAQSLRCNGTSSFIQRPLAPGSSFHCYFQVRYLTFAPYKFVVDWLDSNVNSITRVVTDGFPNKFAIVHGGTTVVGTTELGQDTTYHVWVEWTRGTGADGTMRLFVSTTGVKPGSPEASITTGSGTNSIAAFDVGPFDAAGTTDAIFDRILIDDEPIGSNPGGNSPPSITSISNQITPVSTAIGPIPFTIGDAETNASDLILTGASSNISVVPNASIVFGGSGSNRTVTITPTPAVTANTTITITVSDGQSSAFTSFILTVGNANTPSISSIPNQSTAIDTAAGPLNFTIGDVETSAAGLTLLGSSTNTTLVPNANIVFGGGGSNRTVTVTPAGGQSGVTLITVFVSDGELTNSTSFTLTVSVANTPPTISDITNQAIDQDTTLGPINFIVGDAETPAASLTVTRASSNTGLVPVSAISLGGSGANRTVTITPAAGLTGTSTITLTVSDGVLEASDSFVLTVNPTNPPTGNPGEWLLRESFEGPGYENTGWAVEGGVPNPDYTILPLMDNQSLHLTNSARVRRVFQATNEFYMYCRLRWNTFTLYTSVIYWETAGFTAAASLFTDFNNRLSINHGLTSGIGTTVIQTNTTYHVWIEWTKGTGSDGTMKLFLSTDSTKPVSPEATFTNGIGGSIERMYFGSLYTEPDLIIDAILIADEPIGSDAGSNTYPVISGIDDQSTNEDVATSPIAFTVGDAETAAGNLTVAGASSNTSLVPNSNIVFGGSGSNRTVTVTPAPDQSGSTTITITVNDVLLSTNETFLLTINPINDAPVATLPAGTANYTENTAPVLLDAAATVTDIDSANFDGGALTVDFSANGAPEDRLAIRDQGTGAGQIGVSGASVTYGGVPIGTFTGGTSGSSPLVVSLNAAATPQSAQALARNVTYENVSETPNTALRTVRLVVQDGDEGSSAPATLALTVIGVPDDPGLAWANPASIVYGTALGAAQLNATAGVPGIFAYSPPADVVLNAGSGQILSVTFTPTDTINYTSASTNVIINVTPAPLTITAENTNRLYGAANPTFTATYSGFVNGDDANGLDTPVNLATVAGPASPMGTYLITAAGATDLNYTITHGAGTLTVTAAPLLVTANNASRAYGETNPLFTVTYAGFLNGDDETDLTGTLAFTTAAQTNSPVGPYAITPSGLSATNYAVNFANGTLTITPYALIATADSKTKPYGAVLPTLTGTLVGVQNNDPITATFTTTATAASNVAIYAITPVLADLNNLLTNYTVTLVNGTLTVTAASLPTISIIGVDAGGAPTLRVTSDPGQRVTIQGTSNFTDWAEVITLPNVTGSIDYIDTAAVGQPHRFYRALLAP